MKNSLFFFAHQDDEFGLYQSIINEINKKNNVLVYYFTTGTLNESVNSSERRNKESISVLKKLGVQERNIFFIGSLLNIKDQEIVYRMTDIFLWLKQNIKKIKLIDNVYVHSYEGGHIDHDSLHLIICYFFLKNKLLKNVYQFSLYHSKGCPKFMFKALCPINENGMELINKINFKNRIFFISLIFNYKSQLLTFIALFPFIFFTYVIKGEEKVQKVNCVRFPKKPHFGKLYYENRKFSNWKNFKNNGYKFTEWLNLK